jgi:hypothetical protein
MFVPKVNVKYNIFKFLTKELIARFEYGLLFINLNFIVSSPGRGWGGGRLYGE